MKLPCFGRDRSVEFNVTPLIDVVFLLIIFFLVSSHLAKQETQLELDLPTASSNLDTPQQQQVARVTINVLPSGELLLGSKPADSDEIARRLQVERNQTTADLEVRIRADRSTEYRHVQPLLLACVEAGIWNVSFAVIEGEPL